MSDTPEAVEPSDVERLLAEAKAQTDAGTAIDQGSIDALLNQAQSAPFEFKNLTGAAAANESASLDLLRDVQLDLKIELGRTQMHLEEVLRLKQGAVVTLDKLAGDPVDIYANGRLIARGEVLVLNDSFCVRVAELISGEETV
jgi:flagellar motor switch protein FliN/FliY